MKDKVYGFDSPDPVVVDGFLYFLVALGTGFSACLNSDESAKYLEPATLFWLRTISGSLTAGFLAVKMFRSTAYAAHVEKKKTETEFYKNPS